MNQVVKITINGKEVITQKGKYIVDVARENDIYIPTLCNIPGISPKGACRICSVRINDKLMTSCTTPATEGLNIITDTEELKDMRKFIVELLFVEGNHFCPSCEKSGNCELQALAYKYEVMVPRFPLQFASKDIEATSNKLIKDHNRCILCKRCIRVIKDEQGQSIFAFKKRGHKVEINIDPELAGNITDELAQKAMDICPVGALLVREKGFDTPIGERKFDKRPIDKQTEEAKMKNAL